MTIALALIGLFGVLRAIAPSAWLVDPAHVAGGHRDGARERARAARRARDGARAPRHRDRRLHDGHPDRLDRRGRARRADRGACSAAGAERSSRSRSARASSPSPGSCSGGAARPTRGRTRLVPRLPWRSRTAWLLAAIFGSMASAYYGLNAWLPDAYGERGWSDESAGVLLAAMNLTAIPASFLVPWLSDRHGGRRPWLAAHEPRLRDRRRRPGRASRRGLPVGASRGDLAGRHVRARDDAPARPRGAARACRRARRADARRRLHDRRRVAVRARRRARRDRLVRRRALGLRGLPRAALRARSPRAACTRESLPTRGELLALEGRGATRARRTSPSSGQMRWAYSVTMRAAEKRGPFVFSDARTISSQRRGIPSSSRSLKRGSTCCSSRSYSACAWRLSCAASSSPSGAAPSISQPFVPS